MRVKTKEDYKKKCLRRALSGRGVRSFMWGRPSKWLPLTRALLNGQPWPPLHTSGKE